MARVFVRLKLALLRSAFRRSWQQAAGLVLGAVFVLPSAAAAGLGLAFLGRRGELGLAAVGLVLGVLVLAWATLPLLGFGVDETLDPNRLRLLPLRRRDLVVGLTAASAVGIAPLATAVVLAGLAVGLAPVGPGAIVVVAALVVAFGLCLVTARALTTGLSTWLRGRRGRDVIALLGALLGASFGLLGQVPNLLLQGGAADRGEELLARAVPVVETTTLLPWGWPARAAVAGAEGSLLAGLGWLAASVALLVGTGAAWGQALARVGETVPSGGVRGDDADLFPRAVRWLPRSPFGAAVAKELRQMARVPQQRVQLLLLPIAGVAGVVAVLVVEALRRPELVLAAATLAVLAGLGAINAFGADRGAVWLYVSSGASGRAELAGRNAAVALVAGAMVAVTAVAVAALTGGWLVVPGALALGGALLAVLLGVADVIAVTAPYPLPEGTGNPFAQSAGIGTSTALLQGVAALGALVVVIPVGVGVGLVAVMAPGWLPVVTLAALAIGAATWWCGLGIAGRRLERRGPEFVAALSRRIGG